MVYLLGCGLHDQVQFTAESGILSSLPLYQEQLWGSYSLLSSGYSGLSP